MKVETLEKLAHHDVPGRYRGIWKLPWPPMGTCLVATDARAMIFRAPIEGEDQAWAKYEWVPENVGSLMAPLLQRPWHLGKKMPLAVVKEWAGAPVWEDSQPCEECNGTGKVSHFEPDDDTDEEYEETCMDCDEGVARFFPHRDYMIGPEIFNANYLACMLETATDEDVLVDLWREREAVVINGFKWRVFLMRLTPSAMNDEQKSQIPGSFCKGESGMNADALLRDLSCTDEAARAEAQAKVKTLCEAASAFKGHLRNAVNVVEGVSQVNPFVEVETWKQSIDFYERSGV